MAVLAQVVDQRPDVGECPTIDGTDQQPARPPCAPGLPEQSRNDCSTARNSSRALRLAGLDRRQCDQRLTRSLFEHHAGHARSAPAIVLGVCRRRCHARRRRTAHPFLGAGPDATASRARSASSMRERRSPAPCRREAEGVPDQPAPGIARTKSDRVLPGGRDVSCIAISSAAVTSPAAATPTRSDTAPRGSRSAQRFGAAIAGRAGPALLSNTVNPRTFRQSPPRREPVDARGRAPAPRARPAPPPAARPRRRRTRRPPPQDYARNHGSAPEEVNSPRRSRPPKTRISRRGSRRWQIGPATSACVRRGGQAHRPGRHAPASTRRLPEGGPESCWRAAPEPGGAGRVSVP